MPLQLATYERISLASHFHADRDFAISGTRIFSLPRIEPNFKTQTLCSLDSPVTPNDMVPSAQPVPVCVLPWLPRDWVLQVGIQRSWLDPLGFRDNRRYIIAAAQAADACRTRQLRSKEIDIDSI